VQLKTKQFSKVLKTWQQNFFLQETILFEYREHQQILPVYLSISCYSVLTYRSLMSSIVK